MATIKRIATQPMRTVDDIADAVLNLSSAQAAYVTGATLFVTGGNFKNSATREAQHAMSSGPAERASTAQFSEPGFVRREYHTRGLTLSYCEWGDPSSPTVVLVHGGFENARTWDQAAAALCPQWRVIAVDQRGHGESDWASGGAYGVLDLTSDLAALFAQAKLEKAALVGHSLGGAVATCFAALYPEKVTRLCNVEGLRPVSLTAPSTPDETFAAIRAWADKTSSGIARPPRIYPNLGSMARRLMEADPLIPETTAHSFVATNAKATEGGYRWKYDPQVRETALITMIGPEPVQFWQRVQCPALLVYGKESWATSPAIDGRARHFPDARVVEVEKAGHNLHHHQPDAFIALLAEFLSEEKRPSG